MEPVVTGPAPPLLLGDLSVGFSVGVAPNNGHHHILVALAPHVLEPAVHVFEALYARDAVGHDHPVSAAEVHFG